MGSQDTSFNVWTITVAHALLLCVVQPSEAQTQVGFEFWQNYESIAQNVTTFKSRLVGDITERFNFSLAEVLSKQVINGSEGRIRVNFTLKIDTTIDAKIISRNKFEQSLRTANYVLVYNVALYTVNNSTVSFVLSVWDIWHQFVPEIVIACLCGLAALAIFISSIQLLCMNRKSKRKASYAPRSSLPVSHSGTSLGRTNGGFVMEEMNGGHRVHTPKSSLVSTRFGYERDTFYDKLIYGDYEVPPRHMHNFL